VSLWETRISWRASFFGSVVRTLFVLTTMSLSHIILVLCESCVMMTIIIRDAQQTWVQIATQDSRRNNTTIATSCVLCDARSWKFVHWWLTLKMSHTTDIQRYIFFQTEDCLLLNSKLKSYNSLPGAERATELSRCSMIPYNLTATIPPFSRGSVFKSRSVNWLFWSLHASIQSLQADPGIISQLKQRSLH
jgi:hypothetical protein